MKKALFLVPASMAAFIGSAHAALPEEVTDGLTTAGTDLVTLFGAMTAAGILVFVARAIYKRFRI